MGNYCSDSCATCGDKTYEFVMGSYYLEAYQNKKIDILQLNKYDQFFRVVGDPFISFDVKDYMKHLDELIYKLEAIYEVDPTKRYDLELIPYVKFLEHYKE